ncbi:4Fe-4S dicluster domain-containing protein [Methanoculleus sp. Wushi-C6]|uniref:4Fe-4S dicluster domain-containing protein n=1 Tax=Methanoculleus caldifontis TaxID=2651577 RepID=A0ABU3WZG2_9EURY|nr:Coenzyme F420 hydrogenase/dehydrogenase, beta subunit C-terminal domain [Methanoculleus sp. Wushi-C6]MDV2481195.1 4Fe-4S dicluster domain-containing protein [Methanoculleus sp. Wushi-C6]
MKPIVIEYVVERNLCIGCGACTALCPENALTMGFNMFGEYNPASIEGCTKGCGICLKICPFGDGNPDEDTIAKKLYGDVPSIQHRSEVGYFSGLYAGYSKVGRHREQGASGGMATWLLETLLQEGYVDAAICVKQNSDPEQLFSFTVVTTVEGVQESSGSAYYPVELSGVIRHVLSKPGRYAIIGLPCFVKAIRLAQQKNKILRERIVVVLGLTCGQSKSKHYTSYLSALAGLEGKPTKVHYRSKDLKQPAANYYFSCNNESNAEHRVSRKNGFSEVWGNRWFTPNACNYCDDIFAECADATFMDAWLPEYSSDPYGTSLILVRSPELMNLIQQGCDSHRLDADVVDVSRIIRSQRGVISTKRRDLAHRLHEAELRRDFCPKKRVQPEKCSPLERWRLRVIGAMQTRSRQFTPNQYYSAADILTLRRVMQLDVIQLRLIRLSNYPRRVVRYVNEMLLRKIKHI